MTIDKPTGDALHRALLRSTTLVLDWLGGYEGCVKRARSAIAETAP